MISLLNNSLARTTFFSLLLVFSQAKTNALWQQPPEQFTTDNAIRAYWGATDGNGNALAVWSDFNTNTVEASYYSFATHSWTAPVIVSNIASSFSNLKVAMDASGTGLAIWQENGTNVIRTGLFSGGVWSTPAPNPLDNLTAYTNAPDIAMNGNGQGVGIWLDAPTLEIRSAFFNGTSWGPINLLGTGDDDLHIAYSSNGTAIAAWTNGGTIITAYYNGTTWLAPIIAGSTISSLAVGINSSGNGYITWVDSGTGDVRFSNYDGITLTPFVQIAAGPGNSGIDLAVATGGTAVVTWVDSGANAQVSTYNGTSWSVPTIVASNVSIPFIYFKPVSVSVDSAGNALILYGTQASEIFSRQIPLGGSLTVPLFVADNINDEGVEIKYIISALSSNGVGFTFWYPFSEDPNAFASVLISAPTAPTNFVGTTCNNKFATQTDRVNILTWTPSVDPLTFVYYLRRNGVVIAVIPASGPFIYYDHNRCKRVSDVYTLTSVTVDGNESIPVTIIIR